MYIQKKVYPAYNGVWGFAPKSWEILENFYVKSNCNLTVCKPVRLHLTVSYRKACESGMYYLFPQYFCWGATTPPAPRFPHLGSSN